MIVLYLIKNSYGWEIATDDWQVWLLLDLICNNYEESYQENCIKTFLKWSALKIKEELGQDY